MNPMVVTVSQVNKRLATIVRSDKTLGDIIVRGEISNFVFHRTGHIFFSLKDAESAIKAVMFRSNAEKLTFLPEDGMMVSVRCSIQVYDKDGTCQLYVNEISLDGTGTQSLALEQIKEKLLNEGLFERKRPLPAYPEKICIITSESGAALQDMLNVIKRRYPVVKIVLINALVQGTDAAESVIKAINTAQGTGADILIIGRGGGSAEDLGAFNNEKLARTVFASRIPTISAVGHETDTTLCDYVADLRAPTPSAAAELAVPDIVTVVSALNVTRKRLYEKAYGIIENRERQLLTCVRIISGLSPREKLEKNEKLVDLLKKRIITAYSAILNEKQLKLEKSLEVMNALNPLNTLKRGYSIVYKDDNILSSISNVNVDDKIKISVSDGEFEAVITKIGRT